MSYLQNFIKNITYRDNADELLATVSFCNYRKHENWLNIAYDICFWETGVKFTEVCVVV